MTFPFKSPDQFVYCVFQVDGVLTLGENIADNGGIKNSYQVRKSSPPPHPSCISIQGMQTLLTFIYSLAHISHIFSSIS